jgi:hypothetical protein
MEPERWQEIERLFDTVLERKPEERAAYLNSIRNDESLRREVESLLAPSPKPRASSSRLPSRPPRESSQEANRAVFLQHLPAAPFPGLSREKDWRMAPSILHNQPIAECRTSSDLSHPSFEAGFTRWVGLLDRTTNYSMDWENDKET